MLLTKQLVRDDTGIVITKIIFFIRVSRQCQTIIQTNYYIM